MMIVFIDRVHVRLFRATFSIFDRKTKESTLHKGYGKSPARALSSALRVVPKKVRLNLFQRWRHLFWTASPVPAMVERNARD